MTGKEVMEKYVEALNKAGRTRDYGPVGAFFTEEAVLSSFLGSHRGRAAIVRFFSAMPGGSHFAVSNIAETGNQVTAGFQVSLGGTPMGGGTYTATLEGDKIKSLNIEVKHG